MWNKLPKTMESGGDTRKEPVNNRSTKFLGKIILGFLLVGIVGGVFELVFASLMVESFATGAITPDGTILDLAGVVRDPSYIIHRNNAIILLLMASILYPIWVWFSNNQSDTNVLNYRKSGLIIGLLLPSFYIYGMPGPTNQIELTGVVTPLYNFIFTWYYHIASRVTLTGLYPHQFALLGIWILFLALLQIVSLRFLEQDRISVRTFLIPAIVNLVFMLLLSANALPSSFLLTNQVLYSYALAQLNVPIPMFTIGVLIRGRTILKIKSTQGL